jgi:hypothetical protein
MHESCTTTFRVGFDIRRQVNKVHYFILLGVGVCRLSSLYSIITTTRVSKFDASSIQFHVNVKPREISPDRIFKAGYDVGIDHACMIMILLDKNRSASLCTSSIVLMLYYVLQPAAAG